MIDWDFNMLDSLIQDRGDVVVWETAIACPACRREDATAAFNEESPTEVTRLRRVACPSCHSTGFLYRNAQTIKGLITQVATGNRQLIQIGIALPGDLVFSPSLHGGNMNDGDKLTLCVPEVLTEGQVIQRNAARLSNAQYRSTSLTEDEDRLWYNSTGCAVWCEDEHHNVYDVEADFKLVDNRIQWLNNKPADGVFYVLKYHFYPEYIVYASPMQRVDRGRDLKQRVILRMKHVAYMNDTETPTPQQRQEEQVKLTGRMKL